MERIPFGVTLASVKGGTGMYDGELPGAYPVKWAKRDCDDVVKDEEIASVETDKVMLSVTAPVSGRIASIFSESEWSANGETIESLVGVILAPVLGEIETDSADSPKKVVESWENEGGNGTTRMTPLAKKIAERQGLDARNIKGTGPGGRVCAADVKKAENSSFPIRAVPAARVRAEMLGLELSDMKGTGPDGLILLSDVDSALWEKHREYLEPVAEMAEKLRVETQVAEPKPERYYTLVGPPPSDMLGKYPGGAPTSAKEAGANRELHPTSTVRKTIARLLTRSWKEIPHGRDEVTADVTHLVEFLKMYKTCGEQFSGIPVRLDYIVAWYSVCLLKEKRSEEEWLHPVNVYWDKEKEEVVRLPEINIGIAVETERGLMIPVARNAGVHNTFGAFAAEIEAQVKKVKDGAARLSDMRDLTFTVNNTGALGGESPSSILPYAICSDGSERPTSMMVNLPKIREEEGRFLLSLTMFFDHRPFDGDVPMAFIKELRRHIEEKETPGDFVKELFK